MNAYITDNMGQRYKLVQFFNHEEQKYLFALEFVPNDSADSLLAYQAEKARQSADTPSKENE